MMINESNVKTTIETTEKEVAILGDAHIPTREPELPGWVQNALQKADHVIHVGDFDTQEAFSEIRNLTSDLTAVRGNCDPDNLGLPTIKKVELAGVEFVVTHGSGPPHGWIDRMVDTVQEHAGSSPTIGVGGHQHEALDQVHNGTRILNPGSATGANPADETSMLLVEVNDGRIDVDIIRE